MTADPTPLPAVLDRLCAGESLDRAAFHGYADIVRLLLERDPDNTFAHNQLGSSLLRQSRFLEAIPHLEIARDTGPGWPSTSFNLALCLTELGRMTDAVVAAEDLLGGEGELVSK